MVAALALRRLGIEVVVLEQAPELSEIGSGITLWTNAVKALRHLDAADVMGLSGNFIERGELRSWHGDVLGYCGWEDRAATRSAFCVSASGGDHRFLHN